MYALDFFMLAEVCRKMSSIIKKNLPEEKWESIFPIKVGSLTCKSMIDASKIANDLLNFNLKFYDERRGFDNKSFVRLTLSLKEHIWLMPHIEDLWED